MKKTALFCGVVVAAATVALIIALRSAGKADVFKLAHWSDLANGGNLIIVTHAVVGTLTFAAGLRLVHAS